MNKLFTKITSLALGAAMMIGVGVSVGSKKVSSAYADSFTFEPTSSSAGTLAGAPTGVTASFNNTYNNANQVTGGNSMTLTLSVSGDSAYYVTGIRLHAKTNKSKGAGTATAQIGSTTIGSYTYTVIGQTYANKDLTMKPSASTTKFNKNSNLTVVIECTKSSVYCDLFTFTYSVAGGDDPELDPLDAPSLTLDGTTVSWGNITGNTGYSYSITGQENKSGNLPKDTTSINVGSLGLAYGNYSITVTAKGDGSTSSDSPASTALPFTLSEPVVTGTFNKYSGVISEGDYILTYDNNAINTTISSKRLQYTAVTPSNNSINNPAGSIVWHIAKSGNYWTIYNSTISQYVGSTSNKNEAALLDEVSDNAKWTASGSSTYDFENLARSTGTDSGNKWLRKNGTYGFACYASGTGGALTLYKKHVAYTITYNSNGGGSEVMPDSETVVSSCGYSAPSGKEFDHWSTSSTDKGTSYNPGDSVTANCTLYAIWKDKIASVSVEPTSISLEIGGSTKTVTATTTNIDNPTYSWARSSGDDCISLTNSDAATVSVGVKNGITTSGDCVLTVTVSGKLGTSDVQRTADVTVSVVKTSSPTNPYSVAEARTVAAALAEGTTSKEIAYIKGRVSAVADESYSSNFGNKTFWLTDTGEDDENNELEIWRAYYTDAETKMTEAQFNSINIGDELVICGYLKNYGGTLETEQKAYVYSHVKETKELSLSLSTDELELGSSFVYNGTVSTSYTVRSNSDVTNSVTYSGYDMNTLGNQEVTVTYHDPLWDMDITGTYILTVKYASVTSVTLTEHAVNMGIKDTHEFTAELNPNVDPSTTITWSVANGVGSNIPTNEFSISTSGKLTTTTETAGVLIVTASCSSYSDNCTVTVTGDPYATFDKGSIEGIVGATLDNKVTATANGLSGTSLTYTWSVTSGSDVVSATSGNATTTLTFKKAGTATLHVSISDGGAKTADGDIEVSVIESLNTIKIPGSSVEHNETIDTSEQGFSNGDVVETINSTSFSVTFDKGTNSNTPKYYNSSVTIPAIRLYGGGTMKVSSTQTMTKVELGFGSGDGSNTISANSGSYSNGVWTGSASEVIFSVGGTSGNRRFATIKIYWETTSQEQTISNTDYQVQKAVIEFAKDLTSKLNAVCDQDHGQTPISGEEGLDAYWTAILGTYNSKKTQSGNATLFNQLIANCSKSEAADADPLQKALSSYDYVCAKYGAQLTSGDFLNQFAGRESAHYPSIVNPISLFSGESTPTTIIIIISVIGVSALGGFFFLRKRKEI